MECSSTGISITPRGAGLSLLRRVAMGADVKMGYQDARSRARRHRIGCESGDGCSCGGAPESVAQAVKARLKEKGKNGTLELLEDGELMTSSPPALPCSASTAYSSSDEESSGKKLRPRRTRSGRHSVRMGRRSEEAIVCHPESSLVAVMVHAITHRVSYIWVVDEEDYGLM